MLENVELNNTRGVFLTHEEWNTFKKIVLSIDERITKIENKGGA